LAKTAPASSEVNATLSVAPIERPALLTKNRAKGATSKIPV
jgi:hypothetical protein